MRNSTAFARTCKTENRFNLEEKQTKEQLDSFMFNERIDIIANSFPELTEDEFYFLLCHSLGLSLSQIGDVRECSIVVARTIHLKLLDKYSTDDLKIVLFERIISLIDVEVTL
jgi:hypothetical protein